MQTFPTLRRYFRAYQITDKEIASLATKVLGKPVAVSTVSSWCAGYNRWPMMMAKPIKHLLKSKGVLIYLSTVIDLFNMTRDEIREAEGQK